LILYWKNNPADIEQVYCVSECRGYSVLFGLGLWCVHWRLWIYEME